MGPLDGHVPEAYVVAVVGLMVLRRNLLDNIAEVGILTSVLKILYLG